MRFPRFFESKWKNDPLFQRIVKNSAYLFSSNTLGILLGILSSILSARVLGVEGLGILAAITTFASLADKLLSFRIGELVVKYGSQFLSQQNKNGAAAVFKTAALTEFTVSLLSYALVVVSSSLAATYFAKDPTLAKWFLLYGLIIPAGFIFESASGLLQLAGKFKFMAAVNLTQNIITTAFIGLAFFTSDPLLMIIVGYIVGKMILGLGYAFMAIRQADILFGAGWWKTGFGYLPPKKEFWGFAFSSNFSATVNLLVRDSDILWVNFFLSPLYGGYYKLAVSLIGFMLMPVDPLIKTSYPEIARHAADQAWGKLISLLKRLTALSGALTLLFGLGLWLFGKPLIGWFYGVEFLPAWEPALILFIGYGFANTFFWNRPLLLALGEPVYPLLITAVIGTIKLILSYLLLQSFGIIIQASLMSFYFVISISLIMLKAFIKISRNRNSSLA